MGTRSQFLAVVAIAITCALAVPIGAEENVQPGVGHLKVHSNPAVPTVVSADGVPMDGWSIKSVPLPVGEHEVSFSDVPGFATPAPMMVSILEGDTTTVIGHFAELGLLRVVSEPAVKATISVDGIPRDDYGVWMYVEPGVHTVSFGPVAGYDAPADQTVKVRAGSTSMVTGVFSSNPEAVGPSGVGFLRVTSSPSLPTTISVNGVPRDAWGLSWLALAPGTYEVSFSDVPGFSTPAPQTLQVSECGVTIVDGAFTQLGGLRVVTAPPNSAVIYVNGIARDSWGIWLTLPEGWYEISFGAIPGHDPLPPQTVLVVPGQTVLVAGKY